MTQVTIIFKPMISMIFMVANANSSSPYTLTNNTLHMIIRTEKTVIQTAELIVDQNCTITAAATISVGRPMI